MPEVYQTSKSPMEALGVAKAFVYWLPSPSVTPLTVAVVEVDPITTIIELPLVSLLANVVVVEARLEVPVTLG